MLVGIVENVAAKVETHTKGRIGTKLQVNISEFCVIYQKFGIKISCNFYFFKFQLFN